MPNLSAQLEGYDMSPCILNAKRCSYRIPFPKLKHSTSVCFSRFPRDSQRIMPPASPGPWECAIGQNQSRQPNVSHTVYVWFEPVRSRVHLWIDKAMSWGQLGLNRNQISSHPGLSAVGAAAALWRGDGAPYAAPNREKCEHQMSGCCRHQS